jgi:Ulp1 family protease
MTVERGNLPGCFHFCRFLWRHLESWQQQQMYFFTSHFFTQLNGTNGAHELATDDPDERFARVARWTQKETNLFDKRFLFIPINDRYVVGSVSWDERFKRLTICLCCEHSFHWSIAVFCNPGSAIVKKHRRVRRRRQVKPDVQSVGKREVVDLVSGDGRVDGGEEHSEDTDSGGGTVEEEVQEEELQSCREDRLANPPCLLFLDSLRCHRKKKFTKMLRGYLECEWKARFASSADDQKPRTTVDADGVEEEESLVTVFDSESISLLEPNVGPLLLKRLS